MRKPYDEPLFTPISKRSLYVHREQRFPANEAYISMGLKGSCLRTGVDRPRHAFLADNSVIKGILSEMGI